MDYEIMSDNDSGNEHDSNEPEPTLGAELGLPEPVSLAGGPEPNAGLLRAWLEKRLPALEEAEVARNLAHYKPWREMLPKVSAELAAEKEGRATED